MNAPFPLVEELPESLEPADAFLRLAALPHVQFLDSAAHDPEIGRYSFVVADPFRWERFDAPRQESLAAVESRWLTFLPHTASIEELPPLQGGVVGVLGYEFGQAIEPHEPARVNDFPFPAIACGFYDTVVAFDHEQARAWIISQGLPELEPSKRATRAAKRISQFRRLLESVAAPAPSNRLPTQRVEPECSVSLGDHDVTSSLSEEDYLAMVERGVEHIHNGDVFQVNLSQRLLTPAADDAVAMYLRLRDRNPAPYAAFADLGEMQVASASPESFLRLEGNVVETRPIKGTRSRTGRPEADLFSGSALSVSEKDRAENVMIVDLLRNDLSRTCVPESIHVPRLCGLEQYAFVQHLVSTVRGELRPGKTPFDLLRTCFPGGSITGAPKPRAMQIIAELEPTRRGAYCGSLFYTGFNGRMDSSILIRTLTASGGWWQLPAGGGIVSQSEPRDEYRETWHKARGLLESLKP